MSNRLTITRNALVEYEWDKAARKWAAASPVPPERLIANLRLSCEIEPDVTLLDIFEIVARSPSLADFLGEYTWCQPHAMHAQARLSPPTSDSDNIQYLEIGRYINLRTHRPSSSPPDVSIELDFAGVSMDETGAPKYWSVSLGPLSHIAHLPVRLKKICGRTLDYRDMDGEPPFETYFTLLDILDTIYDDLSFYGGEDEKEELADHLRQCVEGIADGTLETVPFDALDGDDAAGD